VKRRLFTLAAVVLSLALPTIAAIGWYWSASHPYSWSTWARIGKYQAANQGNTLSIQWHQGRNAGNWPVGIPDGSFHLLDWGVFIPYWQVMAISLLPMVALLVIAASTRRIKRRRQAMMLCTTCGYDLRATPERCPECGTPA
jgi:hypothetical protein